MFESIALSGLAKSKLYGYAAELAYFKGKRAVTFKPGLNVLFGPNGCGKSTMLGILANTMAATEYGASVLTQGAVSSTVDLFDITSRKPKPKDKLGLRVCHDGQPVLYLEPRGGQRGGIGLLSPKFDNGFLGDAAPATQKRLSHGQRTLMRASYLLAVLSGQERFPGKVAQHVDRQQCNEEWKQALDIVQARMAPTCSRGQRTVLLDEPESGFSLVWQARLWDLLASPQVTENFQVIVASHSPLALDVPGANYIEFETGYLAAARAALRGAWLRAMEATARS